MIEIHKLTKRFGLFTAVDDISFSVQKGSVLGFLGPNGAGKSTTMKMITGFLSPTSGSAKVCGHDVESEPIAAKSRLGYLPEGAPLYPDMTPRAFLGFIAELRGMAGDRRARIEEVVAKINLQSVLDVPIEHLSKGYKRRVGIAQAILHDPEVLVLDEPTDGLDPNQKHEVRALIRSMARDKVVILSTHILEEVEAVCSRAVIIDRGKIVANGTPRDLKMRAPTAGAVLVQFTDGNGADVAQKVGALPGIDRAEVVGERPLTVRAYPHKRSASEDTARAINELAAKERWPLQQLHVEEGRLDEVFRSITLPDTKKEATK